MREAIERWMLRPGLSGVLFGLIIFWSGLTTLAAFIAPFLSDESSTVLAVFAVFLVACGVIVAIGLAQMREYPIRSGRMVAWGLLPTLLVWWWLIFPVPMILLAARFAIVKSRSLASAEVASKPAE